LAYTRFPTQKPGTLDRGPEPSPIALTIQLILISNICNAEVCRTDFTTFRRARSARGGGGGFIYVKIFIAGTELWVDDNFEMIAAK
jgi:hypothetical protein